MEQVPIVTGQHEFAGRRHASLAWTKTQAELRATLLGEREGWWRAEEEETKVCLSITASIWKRIP
jgi:hypothetical protein